MSVADKLTQLTTIRGDIRSALTAKGVSASDHDFADFATDIGTIQTGGSQAVIIANGCGANATVTATKGQDTVTATADEDGTAYLFVDSTGTWVVSSTGATKTASVNVTSLNVGYDIILSLVPKEYQQVDYIESSGTQYINTQIKPVTGQEFEAKFSNFTYTNDATLIGAERYNPDRKYSCLLWSNNWYMNVGSAGSSGISYTQADEYIIKYVNGTFSVNDNQTQYSGTPLPDDITLFILARNNSGSVYGGSQMKCRLHYFKLAVNGTPQASFVPCYRKSDKVIGLYDIINGQFHTNAGSGSFTCYPSPT